MLRHPLSCLNPSAVNAPQSPVASIARKMSAGVISMRSRASSSDLLAATTRCCGRGSHRYVRLCLSFSYFVLAIVLTAVTMVFVHDRVPDQSKFPPLPGTIL